MADIDVVKKGSRAWIWIMLALVLAIMLFFILGNMGPETRTELQREGGQPRAAVLVAEAV